jgi:hypothetical protein
MYGGAVLDACQQIKARMKEIAEKANFATFAEVTNCCYITVLQAWSFSF